VLFLDTEFFTVVEICQSQTLSQRKKTFQYREQKMPIDRASKYARLTKSNAVKGPRAAVITAHVTRTPKGKIRLTRVGITIGDSREVTVHSEKLSDTDPRLAFENNFGVRKEAHDIVKKSGRYSRFYDTMVRVVYDGNAFGALRPFRETSRRYIEEE